MRRAAWLSLFAVLLLYIAPLISMSMVMSMPRGHNMSHMQHHAPAPEMDHAQAHMSWCAYCDLLPTLHAVFSPILAIAAATFLLLYRTTSVNYQFYLPIQRAIYRPRAPPLTASLH